jgi:hypothetical protein
MGRRSFCLVDFHRLAVPIILILAVGGVVSFFLAYNFYPKKNVNVDFDGICYELLGSAYEKYKKLDAQRAIAILKFQYEAIEPPNALIPISFSGTEGGIKEFSSKYNIEITENNQIGDKLNNGNKIDKFIVNGIVPKPYFRQIIENLTTVDFDPLIRTVQGSLGVRANSYLTQDEGREIARDINKLMRAGIKQIVENGDTSDIHPAECRTNN